MFKWEVPSIVGILPNLLGKPVELRTREPLGQIPDYGVPLSVRVDGE